MADLPQINIDDRDTGDSAGGHSDQGIGVFTPLVADLLDVCCCVLEAVGSDRSFIRRAAREDGLTFLG